MLEIIIRLLEPHEEQAVEQIYFIEQLALQGQTC